MNIQTQTNTSKRFFFFGAVYVCHITSSSHLVFQELKLLLQTQRHKDCHGHGVEREEETRHGKGAYAVPTEGRVQCERK